LLLPVIFVDLIIGRYLKNKTKNSYKQNMRSLQFVGVEQEKWNYFDDVIHFRRKGKTPTEREEQLLETVPSKAEKRF
jgi:hypothetical protein